MEHRQLPISKHFELEKLAEGVYVALHREGGGALSNAGIVDLGNHTLIFDTFFTPQAAADLKAAAESLTGRSLDVVINSHYHKEHVWGNQAFPENVPIISTGETRQLMATHLMDPFASLVENGLANLELAKARYGNATKDYQRHQRAYWVDYYQAFIDTQWGFRFRLPNLTFERHLALHGTKRSAELITYGGGHTKSDVMLFLPQEEILFMGDLLVTDHHPNLVDGHPNQWLRILEMVRELEPKTLIPGHGPVGSLDSLNFMFLYIGALDELTHQMVSRGDPEANIGEMAVPEPFEMWRFETSFKPNIHFLYRLKQDEILEVHA